MPAVKRLMIRQKRENIVTNLERYFGSKFEGKVDKIDHHLAHLSSSFHISPFEEALSVSVDGFGDFASTSWGIGSSSDLKIDGQIYFPHSLGIFYQAMTQWLGFKNYGDEYKIMGLAPYGQPKYVDVLKQLIKIESSGKFSLNLKYFQHHNSNIEYDNFDGVPKFADLYSKNLIDLIGESRKQNEDLTQVHFDYAKSIQVVYEDTFFNLLSNLHKQYGTDNLTLSGGCGMNSVANGKIYQRTNFKRLYVQSAAGDAGGAVGAALTSWVKRTKQKPKHVKSSYFGPCYSRTEIDEIINTNSKMLSASDFELSFIDEDSDLYQLIAKKISNGDVIGWFQGRMEWGPRALGNRSILADPRNPNMKSILNKKIKKRESFRPFAPSILDRFVEDWFETVDDVPFMMKVFKIVKDKRLEIPAVTHVDGSGRLQTVHMATNERYYRLIEAFYNITGVPIVLNTSFNENEPVVCNPQEALNTFIRTKMDCLVLGNWVVTRI
jgi:carbamoyltransferase